MASNNPFNITFGTNPIKCIDRNIELFQIIDTFEKEENGSHVFLITGARGTGKTALLALCKRTFEQKDGWIAFDVNPEENIQNQVAAFIYSKCRMKHLFIKSEFNYSFHGFGINIEGKEPVTDLMTLLEKMFIYLKKKGIKVLIALDEATNNKNLKSFIHVFQILLRNGYPIYFVLTGLYENISSLENNKSLTFLFRAERILLTPLNVTLIASSYKDIFKIDDISAYELAKFTEGYAFAYQLLGYLLWFHNKNEIDNQIINQFDSIVSEKAYRKIWSSLPNKEKEIVTLLRDAPVSNQFIMEQLKMKKNALSEYKIRLSRKGIISVEERGMISIALPRFKEFIRTTSDKLD